MAEAPVLEVRGLSVHYGPIEALRGVDLTIGRGDLVFVAGPNGAGKSTLLHAIAGTVKPSSGDILLGGTSIGHSQPNSIVGLGFTLVPEGREIFASLKVRENLEIGSYLRRSRVQKAANLAAVLAALPELATMLDRPAGLLSGGQQQMLAVGRALMTDAQFIAIDEPSLGLAPKVTDRVYEVLLDMRKRNGLTLLIAEQSFTRAVLCDARLLMLRSGSVIQSGQAREMSREPEFQSAYFGL